MSNQATISDEDEVLLVRLFSGCEEGYEEISKEIIDGKMEEYSIASQCIFRRVYDDLDTARAMILPPAIMDRIDALNSIAIGETPAGYEGRSLEGFRDIARKGWTELLRLTEGSDE